MLLKRKYALEVTIRDMYTGATDTIILEGEYAKQFKASTYKSNFLILLESVTFESPYVIALKEI